MTYLSSCEYVLKSTIFKTWISNRIYGRIIPKTRITLKLVIYFKIFILRYSSLHIHLNLLFNYRILLCNHTISLIISTSDWTTRTWTSENWGCSVLMKDKLRFMLLKKFQFIRKQAFIVMISECKTCRSTWTWNSKFIDNFFPQFSSANLNTPSAYINCFKKFTKI